MNDNDRPFICWARMSSDFILYLTKKKITPSRFPVVLPILSFEFRKFLVESYSIIFKELLDSLWQHTITVYM